MAGELQCCCCGKPLHLAERIWLQESGDFECEDCHDERVRCDPCDQYDHGHPYYQKETST